jgi:hypothetical protein
VDNESSFSDVLENHFWKDFVIPGPEKIPLVLQHLCSPDSQTVLQTFDSNGDNFSLFRLFSNQSIFIVSYPLTEETVQFEQTNMKFADSY